MTHRLLQSAAQPADRAGLPRVLIVHNRYRSAQPSGENAVVEEETALLEEHGCDVERLETDSDAIAGWGLRRKAALPAGVVWSREGHRLVREAIRRFRPDVVHLHNTFPLLSPSALWAASGSRAAVVQTLHNFRPLCAASTLFRDGAPCEDCVGRPPLPAVVHACYRGSRLATLPLATSNAVHGVLGTWRRCVDLYLVPSAFARTRFVRAGWPESRLVVKYNTVRERAAGPAESRSGFVCLSRLTPEKGVAVLLDAWRRAGVAHRERLTVVGSGPLEDELRAKASDLSNVDVLGHVPPARAADLVGRARALVLPSRWYEVFPRAIVEAYAAGTPVVASRLGSMIELVEEGVTGLLAAPGSADELAAALDRLADEAPSAPMSAAARARYVDRYSPQATVAAQLDAYDRARASRASRPARA